MAIISTGIFLPIVDRLAGQYKLLNQAIIDMLALYNITYFEIVTTADDSDVELPISVMAKLADTTIDIGTTLKGSMGSLLRLVSSINAHFNLINFSGGYDQYLINNDLRVSDYFNQLYVNSLGTYLLAKNVFCEVDTLFGTVNLTSGPAINYVDGLNFGNGSVPHRLAKDGNFAATQLKIHVVAFGGVRCDLSIVGTDKDNNILTTTVSIPAITSIGADISIGSSSVRYLDVGSVSFANSNHGSVSDNFQIRNIKERII